LHVLIFADISSNNLGWRKILPLSSFFVFRRLFCKRKRPYLQYLTQKNNFQSLNWRLSIYHSRWAG
jgi:hypothetical protein